MCRISSASCRRRCGLTSSAIAFDDLKGKVVGVLGAGASAFDAAAAALEHGAKEVHLYSRRAFVDYQGGPPPSSPTRRSTVVTPTSKGSSMSYQMKCAGASPAPAPRVGRFGAARFDRASGGVQELSLAREQPLVGNVSGEHWQSDREKSRANRIGSIT